MPTDPIIPSKGLLSSYLFILYTEHLIGLLKVAESSGFAIGVKICRGAPILNHMLFADYSIIFCKADVHISNNI